MREKNWDEAEAYVKKNHPHAAGIAKAGLIDCYLAGVRQEGKVILGLIEAMRELFTFMPLADALQKYRDRA